MYTFLIGQITGRNGIDPMVNGVKGNDMEFPVSALEQRIGHLGNLKVLVVVHHPTKAMGRKMLKKVVDDAFGLSAARCPDNGNTPSDIGQYQLGSLGLQHQSIFFINGIGFLVWDENIT